MRRVLPVMAEGVTVAVRSWKSSSVPLPDSLPDSQQRILESQTCRSKHLTFNTAAYPVFFHFGVIHARNTAPSFLRIRIHKLPPLRPPPQTVYAKKPHRTVVCSFHGQPLREHSSRAMTKASSLVMEAIIYQLPNGSPRSRAQTSCRHKLCLP